MLRKIEISIVSLFFLVSCSSVNNIKLCSDQGDILLDLENNKFAADYPGERYEMKIERCKDVEVFCIVEPLLFIDPEIFQKRSSKIVSLENMEFQMIGNNENGVRILSRFKNSESHNIYYYSNANGLLYYKTESQNNVSIYKICQGRLLLN